MFADGSIAVALVKNQVMIVQAARTHTTREKYLEVRTYTPFGEGVFLPTEVPIARICSSDLLTVLPPMDASRIASQGILELPKKAFSKYIEYSSRHQKRYESLWSAWVSKH
ncbi:hypothetical protein JR316_0008232 [Psilocybe cubensis]|uniref:Uncharacterized protein n=2 Tax=Psilocybe cubensis TaxID=181762 RepID=A0A8H8CHL6_PSICU|nr:hypothetical protein JR316_0008232 [Psilocybe cubensis]KAH9479637.1 hypothetical protein JR316_0008232 [Psilocybe cubensis]